MVYFFNDVFFYPPVNFADDLFGFVGKFHRFRRAFEFDVSLGFGQVGFR